MTVQPFYGLCHGMADYPGDEAPCSAIFLGCLPCHTTASLLRNLQHGIPDLLPVGRAIPAKASLHGNSR